MRLIGYLYEFNHDARSLGHKVSIKLIVSRGKRFDNEVILKWRLQVSRRALVNVGFLHISNSSLTL
jgi:hypothetical protein